jgi:outer membrane protein assembly factor BamB
VNFPRSSYNPLTHDYYICSSSRWLAVKNVSPTDWHQTTISTGLVQPAGETGRVTALNMATNTITWQNKFGVDEGPCYSGTMPTAGGLLFAGSRARMDMPLNDMAAAGIPYGGILYAFDARTGKTLWSYRSEDILTAPPITWMTNGKQYIGWYLTGKAPTTPGASGKRDLMTVFSL